MYAPDSSVARSHIRTIVREEIMKFADSFLAEAIGTAIGNSIAEAMREALKDFRYMGNYQEAMSYKRGNFVSQGGGVWHCNRDTAVRPGTDDDWTLAVKSGRDGRDGKDALQPASPAEAEQASP